MQLFARRTTVLDPSDPNAHLEAYREGRRDERRNLEGGGLDHRLVKKELDEAYARGRREGRTERRASVTGMLSTIVLALVIIGGVVMIAHYGSFGAAGTAIDQALAPLL